MKTAIKVISAISIVYSIYLLYKKVTKKETTIHAVDESFAHDLAGDKIEGSINN